MADITRIDRQLLKLFSGQKKAGVVHSIFDKAINILSADEQHLISIALETVVQSPQMMKTDDELAFSRLRENVSPLKYWSSQPHSRPQ